MSQAGLEKDVFGTTAEGTVVERYTLRNAHGMTVRLITYGATVTELHVPNRRHQFDDIMVGRVAFRIAAAEFVLDAERYQVTRNDGPHHLHGGTLGFSHAVWQAEPISTGAAPAVRFSHRSPDGDQGYPGALEVTVVYTLTEENELRIDCTAVTDRPTLVNLTHHSYFNLAGADSGDVLRHVLEIDADRWIRAEEPDLPSGEVASVKNTPYDFTQPTPLGARIDQAGGAVKGYDLCYLLNHAEGTLARVATLCEPSSGRRMDVFTTEPAIVLYTSNYLDGSLRGKGGAIYQKHAGVCLETGRPPDAIHHPHFPSTTIRPGQTYRHTCIYGFSSM
jgi:aldose 1-epimerase